MTCLTSFRRKNFKDICDISNTIFPFLSPFNGTCIKMVYAGLNTIITQRQLCKPGVRFTKVFRTELGHKDILVECSVIALCLPIVSILSRYKLVCYK